MVRCQGGPTKGHRCGPGWQLSWSFWATGIVPLRQGAESAILCPCYQEQFPKTYGEGRVIFAMRVRVSSLVTVSSNRQGQLSQGQPRVGPWSGSLTSACMFPMAPCGNTGCRHQHRPCYRAPWTQILPSISSGTEEIMAPGGNTGHLDLRILELQKGHRLWPNCCFHVTFGGNRIGWFSSSRIIFHYINTPHFLYQFISL